MFTAQVIDKNRVFVYYTYIDRYLIVTMDSFRSMVKQKLGSNSTKLNNLNDESGCQYVEITKDNKVAISGDYRPIIVHKNALFIGNHCLIINGVSDIDKVQLSSDDGNLVLDLTYGDMQDCITVTRHWQLYCHNRTKSISDMTSNGLAGYFKLTKLLDDDKLKRRFLNGVYGRSACL